MIEIDFKITAIKPIKDTYGQATIYLARLDEQGALISTATLTTWEHPLIHFENIHKTITVTLK